MSITGLISWCVFGLIVGAAARFIMPGVQKMSLFLTIALGVVGSFVGGIMSDLIFGASSDSIVNPSGWVMSIIGALILLFVVGKLSKA